MLWSYKNIIHHDYGGLDGSATSSKAISKLCLQPPYTMTLEAEMPQPLSYHGLEMIGDDIMIIGGFTTGFFSDAVDTVLSYNIISKIFVQLSSLPFPMLDVTTVQIGDNILLIGGTTKRHKALNTVFKYNWKTRQCTQLPSMKCKRSECAAVVSGHQVFVMEGNSRGKGFHDSVECFDLLDQVWVELPPMNKARSKLTAVCVPAHFF